MVSTRLMRIVYFLCLLFSLVTCLAPAWAVTGNGVVQGPDGQALQGAQVYLQTFYGKEVSAELKTDAAGKFTFDAVVPESYGVVARVIVIAPGYALGGGMLKKGDNVFRLERASEVAGQVMDAKGKPVAGARVRLNGIIRSDTPASFDYVFLPSIKSLQAKFATTTDANGRWTIQGVPGTGKADVELDDPAYVRVRKQVVLGQTAAVAPPLIARPGATLTGRIVSGDGKPATGVKIFAQAQGSGEGWAEAVSGADGAYKLAGLPTGTYNVMADSEIQGKDMVAAAVEGVTAREGKSTPVSGLKLESGAIIEGTVTDATTGKPLADVYVGSYGPHRPQSSAAIINAITDNQGRYQLRVAPGKSYIYLQGAPPGYLRPEEVGGGTGRTDVVLEKGQSMKVPFRLKKGLTVTGIAVDSEGKPINGVRILLGREWEAAPGVTDAAGKWSIEGLKPGEIKVSTENTWQVISPQNITLPVTAPVQVKLRKLTLETLKARVVDRAGQPVSGATFKFQIHTPIGDGSYRGRTEEIVSNTEGHIELSKLRPDDLITVMARKEGYKFASGGTITRKDAAWEFSDVVLLPLTASLEGRVTDAGGKPLAQAQVFSPDGAATTPVLTDATGKFTLAALPEGEVSVMAAQGNGFALTRHKTGAAPVEVALTNLQPPPAGDTTRGATIIQEVLEQIAGKQYYARDSLAITLAPYDPDRAITLWEQANKAKIAGGNDSLPLVQIIASLVELDPARAALWVPAKLELITDISQRIGAAARLGVAIERTNPALAQQLLTQSKEWAKQLPANIDGTNFGSYFGHMHLAALAGRLQDPEAKKMAGKVVVAVMKSYTDKTRPSRDEMLANVAEGVGAGSPALVEQVIDQMEPTGQVQALSNAIPVIARYDIAVAQRLLNRLDETSVAGGEEETTTRGRLLNSDPEYAFGLAAKPVIAELGKTDPAAALALARRVKYVTHKPIALALAAQVQPKDKAPEIFREAIAASTGYRSIATAARIAAMSYDLDPALTKTLFDELKERLPTEATSENGDDSMAAFAFYYARLEPGTSRLMLEAEYLRLQQANSDIWHFSGVIRAMAAVDVDRALAMARAIPEKNINQRFEFQRKIAQYVLAPTAIRATIPFDRWGASDTWVPGTETRW